MPNLPCHKVASDKSFRYSHHFDKKPNLSKYLVHTHENVELLIFVKGDASFVVEGTVHPLRPMDAIITMPGEMHQIYHHSSSPYERIVLTLSDAFFVNHDCAGYRDMFTNRAMGTGNIISGDAIRRSRVLDAVERIERYIEEDEPSSEVVIRCAVIELLHAFLALTPEKLTGAVQSDAVRKASDYINNHLSGDLSLEQLSERFFISKYHLCRMFKKYTGMTVGQYITRKRILLAKSLHQSGKTLSEAAALSGFSEYSSFYKACLKETGKPPRAGLAQFKGF